MTKDDMIRLAREAGCTPFRSPEYWDDVQVFAAPDVLERFADLVAAAEREACAKVCDDIDEEFAERGRATWCAAAIRARGRDEH
jgi:hypothetical protein